jgi:hypothetical protein
VFRPSQKKFKVFHGYDAKHMDLVKFSSPTTVALNRPMIAILDQVCGIKNVQNT